MGNGDSQVLQLALAASHSPGNLPERVGSPQLTEEHGHILAPACKSPSMTLSFSFFYGSLKFDSRKELKGLAQHAKKEYHFWASFVCQTDFLVETNLSQNTARAYL